MFIPSEVEGKPAPLIRNIACKILTILHASIIVWALFLFFSAITDGKPHRFCLAPTPTFGFGVLYKSFQFDYSYTSHPELGGENSFGVRVKW